MSFDEYFPSLKDKSHHLTKWEVISNDEIVNAPADGEPWFSRNRQELRIEKPPTIIFEGRSLNVPGDSLFDSETIILNCLDKQRVREAIQDVSEEVSSDGDIALSKLEDRLGL